MRSLGRYAITAATAASLLACSHTAPPAETAAPAAGPSASAAPTEAAADAGAAAEDDEAAASLREHHRHHHNGGVTGFIAMALDTLGSDPNKRAEVEKIQHDLETHLGPARQAEGRLMGVLADGVAAGAIDTTKVDAAIKDLAQAADSGHEATLASLTRLHALLTPSERAAFVDKVQAHWQVWRKVNHGAEPGIQDKEGRLSHLAALLNLSSEQVDKLSASLQPAVDKGQKPFDPQAFDAHVQAFATAFAADTFDAKSFGKLSGANGDLATHGAWHMAHFYETLNPLLTPEQRSKLAERLHEHLSHQHLHAAT